MAQDLAGKDAKRIVLDDGVAGEEWEPHESGDDEQDERRADERGDGDPVSTGQATQPWSGPRPATTVHR
ncbi:MAG: hypothetical protein ACYCXY_04495 [Acidimicrobiales bacterium]